ncbi:phosphoribosylglycinamide formyltransferase-1 [Clostridium punense]|uniref:Phosphoribosylglycinamide formyltransferase n=1 Tax=Clostridium punense TaxID=1054297 RepID=A0ABS4JYZ1_9CLOT|nr:phosphoribosylglycinamide formyltransferase [Clostridium punense]MBP2020758.1 phosphoribosylglycinamide formyltransferase-1 [Clostridium punense]
MFKVAVLVSGGGSNLQSIIDSISTGYLKDVSIEYVISDKGDAFALERAKNAGIKTLVIERNAHKQTLSEEIYKVLKGNVDLIVLAGFLSIIKGTLLEEFKNKIINIHPSLIPSFCGKGMYGLKVHEAAINYGVKVSGCTVHLVEEDTDAGAIVLQRTVEVLAEDTKETLQKRILVEEHKALPEAIKLFSENKISVAGRHVIVKE